MPLESATTIPTLVPANPTHTDGLNVTDSHIRMIKQVLVSTFPNVAGPVSATDLDLSAAVGLAARVTAIEAAYASLSKTTPVQTFLGPVEFSASMDALSVNQGGVPLVPRGLICLWAGLSTALPIGWLLCDGTNGTPDLRDRFLVGAGLSYTVGQTGGATGISAATSSAGSHSHTGVTAAGGGHTHAASTDAQGSHSHGAATASHVLSGAEMPGHAHGLVTSTGSPFPGGIGSSGAGGAVDNTAVTNSAGGNAGHTHGISVDGLHAHNVAVAAVGDHQHGIVADGVHTHTVSFDNRPLYFSLCYLLKA